MSKVSINCEIEWNIILSDLPFNELIDAIDNDSDAEEVLRKGNTNIHTYSKLASVDFNGTVEKAKRIIASRKCLNDLYRKIVLDSQEQFKLTLPDFSNPDVKVMMQATPATKEAANTVALLGSGSDACEQLAKQGQYIYVIYDADMKVEVKEV